MKKIKYVVIVLVCLLFYSCATTSVADNEFSSPGVVLKGSFPSIRYEGFINDADCGALSFVQDNSSISILEIIFDTSDENIDSKKYVLRIKAEGAGLNVKVTDNFNTFMGPMMGTMATSFVLNYIGNDLELIPVILTGVSLSLPTVVLGILAILPDKTYAIFDGKYTVTLLNAENNEVEYEESFTVDSSKRKFNGRYDTNESCINKINVFYGAVIRNEIVKIVEKALSGGLR